MNVLVTGGSGFIGLIILLSTHLKAQLFTFDDDKSKVLKRHICLPIWLRLEDSISDNVLSELHI